MILNDRQIKELCLTRRMVDPFVDHIVEEGVISYGLSSFGYDIRLSEDFLLFRMTDTEPLISPKGFNPEFVKKIKKEDGALILKPNQYVLGKSIEYIRMPEDIFAICYSKSTYSRCGLIVNISPVDPEFEGYLTIEIANPTCYRIAVYPNEGIAQLVFFRGERPTVTYADREGKYMKQKDITLPFIKGGLYARDKD